MKLQAGTIIADRYRIEAELGSGGFGTVYRANDRDTGRACAFKHITTVDAAVLEQVALEAELLGQIRSAHVPRFWDHLRKMEVPGQALVMEFVAGDDLDTMLKRMGPLPEQVALGYVAQVLEALFHLHAQRPPIVHRDIKPANIRIDRFDNAWLLDLGIGQRAGAALRAGAKAATLAYAAPEQLQAAVPDARSDLYSVGALLFHLLTGAEPPSALNRTGGEGLDALSDGRFVLSHACKLVVEQAMALDPDDRFQSAEEMHRAAELTADPANKLAYAAATRLHRQISSSMPGAIVDVHVLPAQRGVYGEVEPPLPNPIRAALGKQMLYAHQVESIQQIRDGHDVVIATGTGSGKSLCFNLPILERCLIDQRAHALYLYPTKALINDQAHALRSIIERMGTPQIRLSELHGETRDDEAAAAKADPGQLVLSNPDKLHWMLARWFDWRRLFSRLQFVVIDEVHMYRGAFGSNVAFVLRRLLRRCRLLDAAPQIICASATVGNPSELVTKLTGRTPYVVDRNGAERSRRHVVFWRPIEVAADGTRRSASEDAVLITERAVDAGAQVITFARSRQQVELMLASARHDDPPKSPEQQALFGAYRGGYARDDRERIERDVRSRRVRGVFSTTALELGIDIGSISMAVLTGYPGSRMAFHQQAGRAGRRNQDGHIVYIASANPLDNYFLIRQQDLLYGPSEDAVVDLDNPRIAEQHLRCMAHEDPLTDADVERLPPASRHAFDQLVSDKALVRVKHYDGAMVWKYTGDDFPHGRFSIRGSSAESYKVICDERPEGLGELAPPYLQREGFVGAIYFYEGEDYLVVAHDDQARTVRVTPFGQNLFTRPVIDTKLTRVSTEASVLLPDTASTCTFGAVEVEETVVGYRVFQPRPRKKLSEHGLPNSRPHVLKTKGLTIDLDDELLRELDRNTPITPDGQPVLEALHGLEHLLLALIPNVALCDQRDLAGHFVENFTSRPTGELTIYDAIEGGIGYAEVAFHRIGTLLEQAFDMINGCTCVDGCPQCLHAGWCIRENNALDKAATRELLRLLLTRP